MGHSGGPARVEDELNRLGRPANDPEHLIVGETFHLGAVNVRNLNANDDLGVLLRRRAGLDTRDQHGLGGWLLALNAKAVAALVRLENEGLERRIEGEIKTGTSTVR